MKFRILTIKQFQNINSNQVSNPETVYFQGLHLPSGPQLAGMLKLNYNSKQFWSASISVNYFDKIYSIMDTWK